VDEICAKSPSLIAKTGQHVLSSVAAMQSQELVSRPLPIKVASSTSRPSLSSTAADGVLLRASICGVEAVSPQAGDGASSCQSLLTAGAAARPSAVASLTLRADMALSTDGSQREAVAMDTGPHLAGAGPSSPGSLEAQSGAAVSHQLLGEADTATGPTGVLAGVGSTSTPSPLPALGSPLFDMPDAAVASSSSLLPLAIAEVPFSWDVGCYTPPSSPARTVVPSPSPHVVPRAPPSRRSARHVVAEDAWFCRHG
jgi:hypothetical protein